jgi:hypothetical protein
VYEGENALTISSAKRKKNADSRGKTGKKIKQKTPPRASNIYKGTTGF